MREMLAGVWERHKPEMEERLSVLARTSQALAERELTTEERTEAIYAAHKLAGALGTFGRQEGSDIARSLERSLEVEATSRSEIKDAIARLQTIITN